MKSFKALGISIALALLSASAAIAQTGVVYSVNNLFNKAATYRAVVPSLTPVSTATDIFKITGSATKTVYVKSITLHGTSTSGVQTKVNLMKRTTASSEDSAKVVEAAYNLMDSSNATKTATVAYYTANPSTAGTGITFGARLVGMPNSTFAGAQMATTWKFGEFVNQYAVLRGVAQSLTLNLQGVTVTGGNFAVEVEWMEM